MAMYSSVTSFTPVVVKRVPNAINDPMDAESSPELSFLLYSICALISSGVNPLIDSPVNGMYTILLISLQDKKCMSLVCDEFHYIVVEGLCGGNCLGMSTILKPNRIYLWKH